MKKEQLHTNMSFRASARNPDHSKTIGILHFAQDDKLGFSLIETLFAIAILAIIVPISIDALIFGTRTASDSGTQNRALFLAHEGLEAVRNIRDENFSNLTNGSHGIAISGNVWTFSGVSNTVDIFTRTITLSDSGKQRKTITSQVVWQKNPQQQGTITLSTQLTNWQKTDKSKKH